MYVFFFSKSKLVMLAVFAHLGSLEVVGLHNAIKGLFLYSFSVLWDRE